MTWKRLRIWLKLHIEARIVAARIYIYLFICKRQCPSNTSYIYKKQRKSSTSYIQKWNNIVINFDELFVWRIFRAVTIIRMVTFQFLVAEIFAEMCRCNHPISKGKRRLSQWFHDKEGKVI